MPLKNFLLPTFIMSFSLLATAADKIMTVAVFKQEHLPSAEYRKTFGDETLCPSGNFEWIDNDKILKAGSASPILFHTFNKKDTSDMSTKNSKCTAETTTFITDNSTPQKQMAAIEQTIKNDCGDNKTTTHYSLQVTKSKTKTNIDLKIKITDPNKKSKKPTTTTCTYEL